MVRVVSVHPSIHPSMWGGRFVTVSPSRILIRNKKLHHLTYFQARYASFKKMADISPEASNAFKLPLFEISILKNKKGPGH
jgi:hypothetical protein